MTWQAGRDQAEAGSAPPAARPSRDGWSLAVVAAAIVGGALLRAAMARGDLWLDEAWSLDLVQRVSSALQVFYGISHDNNHFLNSLWMFAVGQDRPPWVYRAPAVGLGTASIALAARVEWPHSRAAAVAAALLAATALPLVIFGSEARGYAGLIAATLLAIAAFESAFEGGEPGDPSHRRARWTLGAGIGLGTLCHFTMLATFAVLGLAAFLRLAGERPLPRAIDATLDLFRPALLLLTPAMLAVAAGIAVRHGFEVGGSSPASAAAFVEGYGDQIRTVLGLSDGVPNGVNLVVAGVLVLASFALGDRTDLRRLELAAAAVVLPAGMLLLRLPNLDMARYYLVPGLFLLLAVARLVGRLWDHGAVGARLAAALLLGLGMIGHGVADLSALDLGRGRYGDALAMMAGPVGRIRYGTQSRFQVETVVSQVGRRRGVQAAFVPASDFCQAPPDWLIEVPDGTEEPPADALAGPPQCRRRFERRAIVATNPLSGMRWDIYARTN